MISKLQANDTTEAKRIMDEVMTLQADKITKTLISIGDLNTEYAGKQGESPHKPTRKVSYSTAW